MPTELANEIRSVALDWFAENETVVVTPRDQKRFEVQLDRAIEVLQRASQEDRFQKQFRLLLNHLASWLQGRDDIRDAFVTLRDGALAFVVVRNVREYDEKFEDELSELDFEIANDIDLDLVNLNGIALPSVSEEALKTFLDQRLVLRYVHGNRT